MSPVQDLNPGMIDLLAMAFPRRREPNFAWGNILSMFSLTPGLRGFWPTSSRDNAGAVYDLSGQGRTLSRGGAVAYSWSGLASRAAFIAGTSDYLYRADEAGLDILGTEAFEASPGLTLGGWFYPAAGGTDSGLMSKWVVAANQRSYLLRKPAADTLYFAVSVDGIAAAAINVSTVAINAWQFLAARFTPSTELATWVNRDKQTVVAGVPASIFNSNSPFEIGRHNAANYYTGSGGLFFLYGAALSDTWIAMLYEHSRALYGG